MAEIKIEKKKAIWPFILLGLLALGLLSYFLFFRNKGEETVTVTPTEKNVVETEKPVNSDVTAYLQLIDSSNTGSMSLNHEFTNKALLSLINATQSRANDLNFEIKADMEKAKSYANDITEDPYKTTHADSIRKVATTLAGSLGRMQQAKYPDLNSDAEAVKTAAEKIDPAVLTLKQKDAVYGFLNSAADLLRKMN